MVQLKKKDGVHLNELLSKVYSVALQSPNIIETPFVCMCRLNISVKNKCKEVLELVALLKSA